MFCYKCGNKLPDDALFCNNCGAKMPIKKTQQENDTIDINHQPVPAEPVLAAKEDPIPTPQEQPVLVSAPDLSQNQQPNFTEVYTDTAQNDFKQFVENYVSQKTGYRSVDELINSSVPITFAWLSYGIPFLLFVILGIIRSSGIGTTLLLAVLVSLLVGFCVSQLMASFRRNRLSMKSEVIFEEDVDADDFKEFLNQNLSTQYPYFHQWDRLTWTGGMNAGIQNEIEAKNRQTNLGAQFGSHSTILLARITVGPYQLNLQSGKKSFYFTMTNLVAGWADFSFKKYSYTFKVIPILQATAEYYLQFHQIDSSSNNGIGQAPQTTSVVYTQQVSSVFDSNISTVPAIAEVPTAKKKLKAPIIIAAAVVLVIAAAVTAFMLWKNSYSYNDKKSDNSSIKTPVSEGHYTDDIFIETPVIEGHYTIGFLKKFLGCTPEEIEENFGEIQTDNVSSYGGNYNLEYSYDNIRFLFVGNRLSQIFVSPEIFEQKGETLDKTSDEIEKFMGEPFEFTPYYYDENDSEKMTSYDLRYILNDVSVEIYVNCDLGRVNGVSLSPYSVYEISRLASFFGDSFESVTEQMPGAKYASFDSFEHGTHASYDDLRLFFDDSDGGLIRITNISPYIISYNSESLNKTKSEITDLMGEPTTIKRDDADVYKMIYDLPENGVTVEISVLNSNNYADSVTIVDGVKEQYIHLQNMAWTISNITNDLIDDSLSMPVEELIELYRDFDFAGYMSNSELTLTTVTGVTMCSSDLPTGIAYYDQGECGNLLFKLLDILPSNCAFYISISNWAVDGVVYTEDPIYSKDIAALADNPYGFTDPDGFEKDKKYEYAYLKERAAVGLTGKFVPNND